MVKILIGNLFDSKAQTLVNTVNCVGVMGKGIALEFKKRFPQMFEEYLRLCKRMEIKLGQPSLYKQLTFPWILNFPTKDHWKSVAKLSDIVQGLNYLLRHYQEWGITSLAVPPLGCGEGQLEWRIIGPTLYRYLDRMDIQVELYAPYGTPHEELQPEFLTQVSEAISQNSTVPQTEWVKPAWVALVEILKRIEREPYHWPIGRTTFQKIAFVATREGLPTGLKYKKSSFGPFSHELKILMSRLVNNGLIREERKGRMFALKIGVTFEDAFKSYAEDIKIWEPTIKRITDLFMRLNTQQAEIVATVMFATDLVTKDKQAEPFEAEVLKEVVAWKQRRRPPLDMSEAAFTIRNLAALKWLNVKPSPDLPIPKSALES